MSQFTRRSRLFGIDTEVKDYARAILDNGGGISLNALFAVDAFVKGGKRDGVWDLLLDVGLFAGVDNLNATLVKLKAAQYTPRLITNVNYVNGDYTPTGSDAGLLGNAAGKSLLSGLQQTSIDVGDLSLGFYAKDIPGNLGAAISATTSTTYRQRLRLNDTRRFECFGLGVSGVTFVDAPYLDTAGFDIGVSENTRIARYFNGVKLGQNARTSAGTNIGANQPFIISAEVAMRLRFYLIARALNDSQVSAFSTRINSLMAAFGANVY